MKKTIYLIFSIVLFFSFMFFAHASCTDDEIKLLKEEASNIKVTYKHLGAVVDNGMIYHDRFELKFKNVSENLYISFIDVNNSELKLYPSDGLITSTFINGDYRFGIYSNKCNMKISELNIHIPKFNVYSLNPLCEGVNTDEFPLCGKYYEYDVSYDDFIDRLEFYLLNHYVNDEEDVDLGNDKESNDYLFVILNILLKYRIYILLTLCIILLILLILIIKRRREKNSILK